MDLDRLCRGYTSPNPSEGTEINRKMESDSEREKEKSLALMTESGLICTGGKQFLNQSHRNGTFRFRMRHQTNTKASMCWISQAPIRTTHPKEGEETAA